MNKQTDLSEPSFAMSTRHIVKSYDGPLFTAVSEDGHDRFTFYPGDGERFKKWAEGQETVYTKSMHPQT